MLVELCKGERPQTVARGSYGDIAAMLDPALKGSLWSLPSPGK